MLSLKLFSFCLAVASLLKPTTALPQTDVAALSNIPNTTTHLNDDIVILSTASGCVQAHCDWYKGSPRNPGISVVLQVYHDGNYIFGLSASTDGSWNQIVWHFDGIIDHSGHQWWFKFPGKCGHISYANNFQTTDGNYGLTYVKDKEYTDRTCSCAHTNVDGGCSSFYNCYEYEAVAEDTYSTHCSNYPSPNLCDFRGWCDPLPGSTYVETKYYTGYATHE